MLSGFNTNFRYCGALFHVQTEDSGHGKPHVITHLFYGGNIIASEKRSYSDLLGADDIEESVRKLMEGQHKAMLKQLSGGEHDAVIGERLGPDFLNANAASETDSAAPANITEESSPTPARPQVARGAEPTCVMPEEAAPVSRLSRVFGDRVVSEKPLDEVVLDYLVENARKRKRSGR